MAKLKMNVRINDIGVLRIEMTEMDLLVAKANSWTSERGTWYMRVPAPSQESEYTLCKGYS